MSFLINSAKKVLKDRVFRLWAFLSALIALVWFLTDGDPLTSTEVVLWAWVAEFYHLGLWSARILCPGAVAAFMISLALQKRGKKDEA